MDLSGGGSGGDLSKACRPCGTRPSCWLLFPGTDVPVFHVPRLRRSEKCRTKADSSPLASLRATFLKRKVPPLRRSSLRDDLLRSG
jgi:hypothetical protein